MSERKQYNSEEMIIDELKEIIDTIASEEIILDGMPIYEVGGQHQRRRLQAIAEFALQKYDGDILEIGSHIGLTTKIYAELAQKYGRKVVVIDPWDGIQQGDESVYQEFLQNVEEYKDVITINRISSQSNEALEIIQSGKFAFCWIDGLHTPQACVSDIIACSTQVGIQAVDDLTWAPGLKKLYHKLAEEFSHQKYYNTSCREGYYITNSSPSQKQSNNNKRKIIDTFIFYNELRMLEFRLKELNDHVDYFVLVEATKTHAGHSKPLFFKENIERFHEYLHKIIHVIVDDFPASAKEVMASADFEYTLTSPAWKNENHQRRAGIRHGLEKLKVNDEDIIVISDADEIPKVETLDVLRQNGLPYGEVGHLLQDMYYYNLKCKKRMPLVHHEYGPTGGQWVFAKVINYATFSSKEYNLDSQKIRMEFSCNGDGYCLEKKGPRGIHTPHILGRLIPDGGWHFSYFGNVQFIKNKIKNFAHQEYNNENVLNAEQIYDSIEKGKDFLSRDDEIIEVIEIEDNKNLPNNYEMLL